MPTLDVSMVLKSAILQVWFSSKLLSYAGVQSINNAVVVSGGQQRDSATHIHVHSLSNSLPSRPPHNTAPSSVWSMVGPWLSISNITACTCSSQTPWLAGLLLICSYLVTKKFNHLPYLFITIASWMWYPTICFVQFNCISFLIWFIGVLCFPR